MKSKLVYAAVVFCMIFALVPAMMPASSILASPPGPTHTTWTVDDYRDECPTANFTSIQEAIDNSSVLNGDTIIVYDGIYTENLNIWKSLTIKPFQDNEEAPVIIDGNGNSYAVYINASNVYLGATYEGFIIINASYGIEIYPPDETSSITGVSIINNNISACTQSGMWIDPPVPSESVYGITISDNEISGCPVGIVLANYGDGDFYNNAITDNTIYNCSNMGIDVYNDGLGDIRDNNISCNTIYDVSTGIYLDNAYNGSISGNTINGNTIYNCSYTGINLENYENFGDMNSNTMGGNTIYNCSYYGIYLYSDDSYGDMNDNTIQSNNLSFCYADGIYFYIDGEGSMDGNTIRNNNVYDCDQPLNAGINIVSWSENSSVNRNTIQGNTVVNSSCAIQLFSISEGSMSENTISSNTIVNCSYYGIYLANENEGDMDNNTIQNNNISYCSIDGISLYMSSSASMDDNAILNNNLSDCDNGNDAAIHIAFTSSYESSSVNGNTIQGNTVVNSSYCGIYLYSCSAGNMSGNNISGNTIYNEDSEGYTGIYLLTEYSSYPGSIENGVIEDNTIYGFYNGIYLYDNTLASIDNFSISNNQLWNGLFEDGIGNENGIFVRSAHDISIAENDIAFSNYQGIGIDGWAYNISITANNIHHNYDDGIDIEDVGYYDTDYVNISFNTIHHNYCDGIDLYNVDYADIWSNDIHGNDEGIYMDDCYSIDIYGNDIRNNYGSGFTGIYIEGDSCGIDIYCNNIVGNGYGVYNLGSCGVYAYDNWWGSADGPSYDGESPSYSSGDEISDYVAFDPWLENELTFDSMSSIIINTDSVPSTVSIYDMLWGDEIYVTAFNAPQGAYTPTPTPEADGWYTLGPDYADLIVEVNASAYNPNSNEYDSCTPVATVNLSALLLAMLPADFEEAYVSEWSEEGQSIWLDWLDYLSQQEMYFVDYYADEGVYFYDYPFYLEDLFFDDECFPLGEIPQKESIDIECFALDTFFYEEYENGYTNLYDLILKELRLGDFQIPVTITSCWDEEGTISTIPLTIVDFQLPLEIGWNLRSTPITLDSNFSTWGDVKAMGDGLTGFEAALAWNASSGAWEEMANDTPLSPLNAYFIKMSDRDQMGFIVSREASGPPERPLYRGWNLVSAAPSWTAVNWSADLPDEYPFPLTLAQDALISTEVSGNITGWSVAIGIPEILRYTEVFYYKGLELEKAPYYKYFAQLGWSATNNGNGESYFPWPSVITPGGGYWVFMENPDTLAGFSFTPLFWNYLR